MPPEVQRAIIEYLMSFGMDPGAIQTSFGYASPDEDMLDYQRDATNYMQDRNQMLMDPLSGVMAGSGGFDYAAFEPTVTMEPVDRPGERQLQHYLGRSEGTLERMIAEEIARGGTAASAFAAINAVLSSDDPAMAERRAVLEASIPPQIDYATGRPIGLDLKWVMDKATGLEEAIATDPVGNYQVAGPDGTVQYFDRTEEESDLMKQWKAAGLPDPRQQYSIENAMGPEWVAAREMFLNDGTAEQLEAARERAMKPASELVDNPNIDLGKSLYEQPMAGSEPWRTANLKGMGGSGDAWRTANLKGMLGPVGQVQSAAAGPLAVGLDALPQPNLSPEQVQQIRVRTPQQQAAPAVDPSGQRNKDAALAQLRSLFNQREEARGALYGQDYWTNLGATNVARAQGRTPALDAIMARRMQQYAAGIPNASMMGY